MRKKDVIKKCTPKQDKYAKLVAEGKSYADAYRGSYNVSRMKEESIRRKATELNHNVTVTARIKYYQEQLEELSLITRGQMLKDWVDTRRVNVLDLIESLMEVEGVYMAIWKPLDQWTEAQKRAVKEVKNTSTGVNLVFHDRVVIDDRICKMLGWDAPQKHELKHTSEFDEMSDEELQQRIELLTK